MDRREPSPKREFKPVPPKWSSPIWFLPLMLLLLWFWQSTLVQFAYRTIPYSEFKEHLARREVLECAVKENTVEGKIQPKAETTTLSTNASAAEKAATAKKEFFFRSVRVEDPKLVEELENANVKFRGERPNFLSQFMLAWIVPLGIMLLIWMFISRRMAGAGESIL